MSDTTEQKAPYNPFGEKVIKREYTQDMIKADIGEVSEAEAMEDIPEPTYDKPSIPKNEPAQDIPSSSASSSSTESYTEPEPKHSANPPLEDMSATQKRKAAKETAEAILTAYGRFMPMPFVKISSFNMNKMNKLDMSGEISLKMPVTEEGLTVGSYMSSFNAQVEQTFEVTEGMKDEIREPLIDVLMEQGLALTPTQRLLMGVGGHIMQMGVSTFQLVAAKKDALETFKEFKKSDDKNRYTSRFANQSPPQTPQREEQIVREQPQKQQEASYDAPPKEESYEKPTFDMDDYINSDIPENDSSIEITEVESEQIH